MRKLDGQAVHFTMTTEKGMAAVYYCFEGKGPQCKAPKEWMHAQKWRNMEGKRHKKEKVQSSKGPRMEAPVQKKAPRMSEGQVMYERPPREEDGTPEQ